MLQKQINFVHLAKSTCYKAHKYVVFELAVKSTYEGKVRIVQVPSPLESNAVYKYGNMFYKI